MKNLFRYAARSAAFAAFGLLVPITSHAFLIESTTTLGSQFTVNYLLEDGAADGNGNVNEFDTAQDISATVLFTLVFFDPTSIKFQLDVTNTSDALGNDIGLQAIAFGTDPNATAVTLEQITDSDVNKFVSATLTIDSQLNNAVANLDVQSSTNVGNQTLLEGELDKFFLTIFFSTTADGVTFTPFGSKWQGDPDSFQFGGSEPGNGNGNGNGGGGGGSVPEPASLGLLGLGLLAMGAIRRRKVALKS